MKAGWQTKKLKDVCIVDKCQGIHKELPYVGLEHIESHTGRFIGSVDPTIVKSSTFKFTPAHLLYGRLRPYLNKVMVPDFVGHCSTEIFPIKPNDGLAREFLQYWFLRDETVSKIDSTCTGARMPRANMNAVLEFMFPLPPYSEQIRIVRLLNEVFDGIATVKVNTEKNLQNSRALLESHLQLVFTQGEKGWVRTTLGDVCSQITDGKHGDCKNEAGSGFYFLSAKDVYGGTLNYEKAREITREDFEETHRRTNLEPGDVLITNSGTIGRLAIAPSDNRTRKTTFQKSVAILKPAREVIESKFIYFCLTSGLSRFVNLSAGAAQKNLLLRDLRSYHFALPKSLDQQRLVADKLDALSSETHRLEFIYHRKLIALDALKKSLLHQAFTGQL